VVVFYVGDEDDSALPFIMYTMASSAISVGKPNPISEPIKPPKQRPPLLVRIFRKIKGKTYGKLKKKIKGKIRKHITSKDAVRRKSSVASSAAAKLKKHE
jgi:hypothetical protein